MGEIFGRIFSEPDRYEHVFKSSNTWQIGLLFIGITAFLYLLSQKIGVLVTGKTMGQNWNLLYYGIGATATISGCRNTGTFIKNNPVVQFNYTFEAYGKNRVEGDDKKVIEKDQSPQETEQLEIMYLPNDPSVSRITENLESMEFNRFLNIKFMVVVFIFSAVFIFSFYQTVFNV